VAAGMNDTIHIKIKVIKLHIIRVGFCAVNFTLKWIQGLLWYRKGQNLMKNEKQRRMDWNWETSWPQ